MTSLALKAIAYGADKIPDRLFEAVPGGYFTPEERRHRESRTNRRRLRQKEDRENREKQRHRSEGRYNDRDRDRGRRHSTRARTPPTDHSDYSSAYDTDYESDRRRRRSHRAKSLGRGPSSSPERPHSRGRDKRRETRDRGDPEAMAGVDRREPYFPPPPTEEYKPYNPADYAPAAAATGAAVANEYYDRRGSSVRSEYQQQYPAKPYAPSPSRPPTVPSATASRYTPGAGYAPSPTIDAARAAPPPGGYAPAMQTQYPPYNPAEYAPSPVQPAGYIPPAPGIGTYPTPPPLQRQRSNSQPSVYNPYAVGQPLAYVAAPSRSSSEKDRKHKHKSRRATSVGGGRSRSRMADLRDRFGTLDFEEDEKAIAASAAGAIAGGFAGNHYGNGHTLSTIVGAALGGLGARELEKRHEKRNKTDRDGSSSVGRSKSRGDRDRSRRDRDERRRRDDDDSYDSHGSDYESDGRRRRQRGNSRRRRSPSRDSF